MATSTKWNRYPLKEPDWAWTSDKLFENSVKLRKSETSDRINKNESM